MRMRSDHILALVEIALAGPLTSSAIVARVPVVIRQQGTETRLGPDPDPQMSR